MKSFLIMLENLIRNDLVFIIQQNKLNPYELRTELPWNADERYEKFRTLNLDLKVNMTSLPSFFINSLR